MPSKYHYAEITHPGTLLLKDFLEPLSISQNKLADAMDVSPGRVSEIVNGKRAISAETSIRLGHALGMSDRFWFNMQADYDFRMAKRQSEMVTKRLKSLKAEI